ncbi:MAG: hypothetical protein NTW86_08170 [Candidatus Sumerlaeota bacterium]|nr:hypothetical protein [Candidatus Sumerlaeota bacterium]
MNRQASIAVTLGVWLVALSAATAADTIFHEDFKGPFVAFPRDEQANGAFLRSGALPKGWQDSSARGDLHVAYAASPEAHGGQQALRVEARIARAWIAAQLTHGGHPVKKGCISGTFY